MAYRKRNTRTRRMYSTRSTANKRYSKGKYTSRPYRAKRRVSRRTKPQELRIVIEQPRAEAVDPLLRVKTPFKRRF